MKSCCLQNRPLLYDIVPEDAPRKEIFYQLITFRCCVHWADLHVLDDLRISFLLRMAHFNLVFSLKLFRNLFQLLMELLDLRRGELGEKLAKIEGKRPARYVQAEPRRVCEQAYRTWETRSLEFGKGIGLSLISMQLTLDRVLHAERDRNIDTNFS